MTDASTHSTETAPKKRTKVFRDPVHDLIYLGPEDSWILDLIDTKEFQRLRRIRQLGVAHLVYPGAEHTRFTHSLGVFNFARRIVRKLLDRHKDDSRDDSRDDSGICTELDGKSKTIKVAALLHDLGHGPFSHVFERLFKEEGGISRKHDEWTSQILRDEDTEIHQRLKEVEGVEINGVCSLISDNEVDPPEPYLKDIVSSQLDADRMDYLLRDSLMTGSRYGQFDSEWILNALAIGELRLGDRSVKKLCLDASKGTGAIEGLLFARLLMLKYVYGHKTTRAYEAELIQTLRLALRLKDELPDDTPSPVRELLEKKGDVTTRQYLMLDDEVMWWSLRRWAAWDGGCPDDEGLPDALRRHALRLVRRHEPWKSVEILDEEVFLGARQLRKKLSDDDSPLQFECYIDNLEDLPYKDYRYLRRQEMDEEQAFFREIFLVDREGAAKRLAKDATSPIAKGLTEELQVCRFHFDREFFEEFSGLGKQFGVCLGKGR